MPNRTVTHKLMSKKSWTCSPLQSDTLEHPSTKLKWICTSKVHTACSTSSTCSAYSTSKADSMHTHRGPDAKERGARYPNAFVGQQFLVGRVSINSSTTDPVAVGRFCTICIFLQFLHPSTKSLAHQCAAMQRFNVPYDFGKPLP